MLQITYYVYILLILFTICFQIGLILGMPWAEYTMGGANKGKLPVNLRVGSFISIIILLFISLIVSNKAQIININLPEFLNYFVIVFSILGFILNSITKSKKERQLWQPITFIMLLCILYIFLK